MLTGGVMIALTSVLLDNTALSMVAAIAACAVLAWLSVLLSLSRRRCPA
jgi:DHA1 family bicyclomycin/chloramphenicol resistance-like MFS transporter